jgi:HlyD family secretion protein
VGCRGLIEPEYGVIKVAVPYFDGGPSIIKELKVKEGERVERGAVLAALDGRDPLEAAYRDSAARVEVARQQLAQVKAGAKPADLEAQRQEIERWESEYKITQAVYQRYEKLRQTEDVSASDLDEKRLALERSRFRVEMEKERMASLAEVRPQDIQVAVAELKSSIAAMNHARANLDLMLVRSPISGRVLKIHAHEGEQVGPQGLLELGRTDRMYVAAEVYEDDIARVHLGQQATIDSPALPHPLQGTVEQIGMEVARSETLPTDPAAFSDTRVIKVKIRLADSQAVASLVNGKVDVVIHP